MNLSIWVGFGSIIALLGWGINAFGSTRTMVELNGLLVVFGGTAAVMLINCSFSQLGSAVARFISLFMPSSLPSPEEGITEIVRLSRLAQREGGILSLQGESRGFAGDFLHRAIVVAIASGESGETRRIMEAEIKQVRILRQEDANVFRTIGVLSPMMGLLGTLLGMIRVLSTLSDPTKVGAAMALALSSAFLGIGIANLFGVPVAGQIRAAAMRETLVLELLTEGVLNILSGKPAYLIEMHLAAYSLQRRLELQASGPAQAFPRAAAEPS